MHIKKIQTIFSIRGICTNEKRKKNYKGHATIKSDDALTFGAYSISVQTLEISNKRMNNTVKIHIYIFIKFLTIKISSLRI